MQHAVKPSVQVPSVDPRRACVWSSSRPYLLACLLAATACSNGTQSSTSPGEDASTGSHDGARSHDASSGGSHSASSGGSHGASGRGSNDASSGGSQDAARDGSHRGRRDASHDGARTDARRDGGAVADARRADSSVDSGAADAAVQAIAIPMYVDPSANPSIWTQEIGAAPTVRLLVANLDNGPGTAVDSSYTSAIAKASAAGVTIVGYTYTNYGGRSASTVEADIDSWYSFYPNLEGIFLDEVATDAATATSYYAPLYQYVKAKSAGAVVIVNPGTTPDEAYMSVADIVVTFEDVYANYAAAGSPSWASGYSRWRFWNLVLSTAASDLPTAITTARQRNVGYVYVTDQGPNTAYSQLVTGTYWTAEMAAVDAP